MVKYGERKDSCAVNSDPNSYSKCNTDTNANSYSHPNADPDCNTKSYTNTYFYPNANTDLDRSRTPTSAPMSQQ